MSEVIFTEERSMNGATEVIITETDAANKHLYQQWLTKIQNAEAKFPGFQGVYVQAPKEEHGRYWITFLQFDTVKNLDRWLSSHERKEILKELSPIIKSFETHRIISPYAAWFKSVTKAGAAPPLWKQTMLILLVLFPIVMLEFKFLNPWTKIFNISLATFIGNAISVVLISWPMMPIAIYFFKRWLTPHPTTQINIIGTVVILLLYLLEVVIFWSFV